jgi:hypothetical protein
MLRAGVTPRRVLNTGYVHPMFNSVSLRHILKEVIMPSPRKASAQQPAETEMSSRKKTAGTKASAAKAPGTKKMEVAKRTTKAKPKT